MEYTNCPVCNSSNIKQLKRYQKHFLYSCKSCSFVFTKKIPSDEELQIHYAYYGYDKQHAVSPITIQRYKTLLQTFEKYRKNNRILDIGCGDGSFLETARAMGWEIYAIEYSQAARVLLQNKQIEQIQEVLKSDSFPDDFFDVITAFEVLEHLKFPAEQMAIIAQKLSSGGLFYGTVPNFNALLRYYLKENYSIITYPEHLNYFTIKSLKKLALQHNFLPQKLITTGFSFSRLKKNNTTNNGNNSTVSADENIRQKAENKKWLKCLIKLANGLLNFLKMGDTIKFYLVKH